MNVTCWCRVGAVVTLLGVAGVILAQTNAADPLQTGTDVLISKDSTKLEDNTPHEVLRLSRWPGQAELSGDHRLPGESPQVAFAKRQTTSWLDKVLAPAWLPTDGTDTYFLKDEFGGRDVVRMKWEHDGYSVEVSQTASIFVIKVTPPGNHGTGTDKAAKAAFARDTALRLFKDTGRRWSADETGAGVSVPVPNLAQRIASWSFEPGTTRSLGDTGIVVGRPKTMQEEGLEGVRTAEDERDERKADNPHWDRSALSWRYWFRRVHWWNDGKSLTIYFLKVEEGAWAASYGDQTIDRDFFKVVVPPVDKKEGVKRR